MREFNPKMSNISKEDVGFKYEAIAQTYNDLVKEAFE